MKLTFSKALKSGADRKAIEKILTDEALSIYQQDIDNNKRMGQFGAELMPQSGTILTHCNAGARATAGYGTALGVIRAAIENGKRLKVLADETRPFLQGSRLTAGDSLDMVCER